MSERAPALAPRAPHVAAVPTRIAAALAAALVGLHATPVARAAEPELDPEPETSTPDPGGEVEPVVTGPVTLRLKTAAPRGSPWGELLTNLGARLKRSTDGRVAAKIFWAQKSEAQLVRQCQKGKTDGIAVSLGALAEAVPELDAVGLPFLFASYEEADRALTRAAPLISELLRAKGFVHALRGEHGFLHVATRDGFVTTPAALAGRVMRAGGSKLDEAIWRALGAEPKVVQVADVPDALERGAVVGYDQTLLFGQLFDWSPHISHVTLSAHAYQAAAVVWCQPWFDALPEDLRALVAARDPKLEASGLKLMRVFNDKLMPEQYAAMGKALRALTKEERAAFAASGASVIAAFRAGTTPEGQRLLEALQGR